MIAYMGAGINIRRFDTLAGDADFISVHGKLISNRQFPNLIRECAIEVAQPSSQVCLAPVLARSRT
jgi:hypothetical protein